MNAYTGDLVKTVQERLRELGDYHGQIDGKAGPMTETATSQFKGRHGMWDRPYPGPLTLAALFSPDAKSAPRHKGDGPPPWYALALEQRGLHERRDNAELSAWLRADGATLGDPAALPWCGDYVATAIGLALPDETLPDNPYLARAWLGFGRECPVLLGAVAVFWRGSRNGWAGHVGFVAGEDADAIHVLGGNQSNAVTITRIARSRLLGCRWPTTYPMTGERVARDAEGALSVNEA